MYIRVYIVLRELRRHSISDMTPGLVKTPQPRFEMMILPVMDSADYVVELLLLPFFD